MSGESRVLIPNNVRGMIQDIKEFTQMHSDEDIYAMLMECDMDPNETAQKLLYLDTFQEVKRKCDRRKVNVSSRGSGKYSWTPGMQWRGARGGQGNHSSPYGSNDPRGARNLSALKENGVINHRERDSRHAMPVLHKTEKNATPRVTDTSTVYLNAAFSVSNGSSSRGPTLQLSAASVSGVYSSASDPLFVPSLNSQNAGALGGTIKSEIGSQHNVAESSASLLTGSKSSTGQDVAKTSQATSGDVNSTNKTRPRKSQGVKNSQNSKPSQILSLPTDNGSLAVISNQDSRPPQQLNGPSKVVASEPAAVVVVNSRSLPENDYVLEEATSKLDMKLDKLNLSPHQRVIFPNHFQVPEAFKNQLSFGSFDTNVGGKGSKSVTDSVQGNSEDSREPSVSNQPVSSTTEEDDYTDHPQPPHVPENLLPLEDNVSSGSVLKHEQSKQEIMSPPGGAQFPIFQTTPDSSFGLVPPVKGPHLVQLDGPELQTGNSLVPTTSASGSIPLATQPVGAVQSSMPVSPQFFPFFRQPYPPNYIPYSTYYPHFYLPQIAHQFLGHGGYPQQPSTGNLYVPPASASGVKFPVPSLYNQGTDAGNLSHFGIPSGYGSYGSSLVGCSPSAAVTPGSSVSSEDLAAPELKDKNIYSTVQQGEDSHVRTPAPGRDISGSFSGIYHTTVAPPYLHQSPAMVASIESLVPPSEAYQQSQLAQINWSNTLLNNRENI